MPKKPHGKLNHVRVTKNIVHWSQSCSDNAVSGTKISMKRSNSIII